MLRVALTGGIATGKSYVRERFQQRGVPTIDADRVARDVVAPGTPGLLAVIDRFGREVLDPDGTLNRARLSALVFADAKARQALEAIVHPRVYAAIESWFDARAEPFGVADIPLLFETGHSRDFTVVVVTYCPADLQLQRVQQRDGLSEDAARKRLAAQWPIDEKVRRADYVIRTDGTFAETDAQVESVLEALGRHARSGRS